MSQISTVAATRLREILGQVLDQVRYDHKPVSITRNGSTVAYLVPAELVEHAVRDFDAIATDAIEETIRNQE